MPGTDFSTVGMDMQVPEEALPPEPGISAGTNKGFLLRQRDDGEGVGGSFLGRGNAPMN